MSFLKRHKVLLTILALVIIGVSVYQGTKAPEIPNWTTDTITKGVVRELVSVSGVIEAESEATLTFPVTGIVEDIFVKEGDVVGEGAELVRLTQDELLAERRDAEGALMIAQADQSELMNGPRSEERDVTDSAVIIARTNLEQTVSEERVKVQNAYRALLSNDLEAVPVNANTNATPPTVSGTYTCAKEGVYTITFFRSAAESGYSYKLSGLESGSETAYSKSSGALGTCGLRMQIDEDSHYGNQQWTISVPNTKSTTYPTLVNTYLLAQETNDNAVTSAHDALVKAEREATLANATPRNEARTRSTALVAQASARLASIDARIRERSLLAPFQGIISDVGMTKGESSSGRSLTLVSSGQFALTVRIPEIDITKVHIGQKANVTFDARSSEPMEGTIVFIAPTAKEIDGVAYFEAKMAFLTPPSWMRSGLNADVDITVGVSNESLRIPKRFILREGEQTYLLYPNGVETQKQSVTVDFTGNDGFVAVSGNIREGDTVIAP